MSLRPGLLASASIIALALLTSVCLGGEFGETRQYFAQYGIGGPAETFFTIHHQGQATIMVKVELINPDGTLFDSQDVALGPGATRTLGYNDPAGGVKNGWARLTSDQPFNATVFFRITGFGNVGVLPSQEGVKFKLFVFVGQGTDTGFALANTSETQDSDVTMRIFDTGGVFQKQVDKTYGPGEHQALFVTQDPLLVTADSVIEFTATQPVILVGLRSDNNLLASTAVVSPQGSGLGPGSVGLLELAPEVSFGRVQPGTGGDLDSPNVILGHPSNTVAPGIDGATIGGGGSSDFPNTTSGDFATVGGGANNTASGLESTIGGGVSNVASGEDSTVGGGAVNTASGDYSAIGGGFGNQALLEDCTVGGGFGNQASAGASTVGGGEGNEASGVWSTIGGGSGNEASGLASTVGGGNVNNASGDDSTVGGGAANTASSDLSTVGGGNVNNASNEVSTVGGGRANEASGFASTIGGGSNNDASGRFSTIGGGVNNEASGDFSVVPGGSGITAAGAFSFAAGRGAQALHDYSFVWAASEDETATFESTTSHQFLIQAANGVGINNNAPQGALDVEGLIYHRGGVKHADYVFEDDYRLESIEEHSESMWREKHLPAVGPGEKDDEGREYVEYGSRMRGILEELEKAHIYIEQFNSTIKQMEKRNKGLEAQLRDVQQVVAELVHKVGNQESGALAHNGIKLPLQRSLYYKVKYAARSPSLLFALGSR